MARNRSFSRREERKKPVELAAVPDLGVKITMPRKTNSAAARTVASGDVFLGQAQSRQEGPQARSENAACPGIQSGCPPAEPAPEAVGRQPPASLVLGRVHRSSKSACADHPAAAR